MKIGAVGSGMIVNDCLNALKDLHHIECTALCVREHSLEKGKKIAEQFLIPKVYTNYQQFLKESEVDFVYIGLVNSVHYTYAKEALEAGLNVIVEKPFTVNAKEAQTLITLAEQKELFLFEAITTIHFPNFTYAKEQLSQIGDIKLIQCNFSQYSSRYDKYLHGEVAPAFDPLLCGGALYDLNVYNIYFTVAILGAPNRVIYSANKGYNGVDTSGIVILEYDTCTATLCAAKDSSSPNYALIQGTKGYVKITSQTSLCTSVEVMTEGKAEQYQENLYQDRMQHEFMAFERMYQTKNLPQCYEYLKVALEVMKVLEAADGGLL